MCIIVLTSHLRCLSLKHLFIRCHLVDDQTEDFRMFRLFKFGEKCLYIHELIDVGFVDFRMFPSCKFGEKCLYIHPNCKFDAQCTRKDCPFTHASKRNATTTVIQKSKYTDYTDSRARLPKLGYNSDAV